jgi:hypothetical protein
MRSLNSSTSVPPAPVEAAPLVGAAHAPFLSHSLYHSRGSGSFSGTAYSVPGVSHRSAWRKPTTVLNDSNFTPQQNFTAGADMQYLAMSTHDQMQ